MFEATDFVASVCAFPYLLVVQKLISCTYVQGITISSNGIPQVAIANPSSTLWANPKKLNLKGIETGRSARRKLQRLYNLRICNVVCNTETVFSHNLAGQKHAPRVKKHASAPGVAAAYCLNFKV
ncbi:Uncharacterized protein TCM_018713 [Theobroma cacao]|uniref:Uncharacterized protein n=1 Tax=Theobroma cacao TaxID=3641 RepID=A0A061EFB3_THECC|nr:Uncharacterized protein TCM_018713 [Theobroma cacao]